MFFRRKRNEKPEKEAATGRKFLRHTPSAVQPLTVQLTLPSGEPFEAEFMDMSVGGASARFVLGKDPCLTSGDVIVLRFGAPNREERVDTPAKVVYVTQDGDATLRYGFEFINNGRLYAQLDDYYARFFGRKRSRPVNPHDGEIGIRLEWPRNLIEGTIFEISTSGVSVMCSTRSVHRLGGISRIKVDFLLPHTDKPCSGIATITYRTFYEGQLLLCLQFDVTDEGGFGVHEDALREFVFQRGEMIVDEERPRLAG